MLHPHPSGSESPNISYRFALASTLTAGVALFLVVSLLVVLQFFTLRGNLLADARVQGTLIAENVSAAVLFDDHKAAAETLHTLRAAPLIEHAILLDASGEILASHPADFRLAQGYALRFIDNDHQFDFSALTLMRPVQHKGAQIGLLFLRVSLSALYAQLGLFALISLGAACVAIGMTYIMLTRIRQSVSHAELKLHHLAHVDPVTGLANRHAFNDRISFAIREAERFSEQLALIILDLDNFKQVNDTLGHHAGDELLRLIAQLLVRTLRRDDFIARLGGDEFAVILRNSPSREEIEQICSKLVNAFAQPTRVGQQDFFVTASIGLALYPEHGRDANELSRHADTAMYQAKQGGKNSFAIFDTSMDADVLKRVSIETRLRQALEQGELSLHYQPKHELATRRVTGFEALLRWNNADLGFVSPADFIPLAEDTGLIIPIGEWVLRQAMRDLRVWNTNRTDKLHVAVNLSARQLTVDGIAPRIAQLIAESAIPPDWLELELTESMVMENLHAQIDTFHDLRDLGVRIAIDDFGTGYSSMSYLKRLPIDTLKIDASFVRDLPDDANDMAIATAIIALGHSLGLTVVAEGVETEAQVWALREQGCNLGQGYFFARPMPAHQVPDFLKSQAGKNASAAPRA